MSTTPGCARFRRELETLQRVDSRYPPLSSPAMRVLAPLSTSVGVRATEWLVEEVSGHYEPIAFATE